jgi:CopG family transcriptional regulator/antitoxin EndoAI
MNRRLNISLPETTIRLMDRIAGKGDRSRLIADAVESYIESVGKANLRKRLREGAVRRAKRDLQMAEEWFHLEEEAWSEKSR